MRRSQFLILYQTLKAIGGGEYKQTRIMYASGLSYTGTADFLSRLEGMGLITRKPNEGRERKRTQVCTYITDAGRAFLRDLEALDRRVGGMLLEW